MRLEHHCRLAVAIGAVASPGIFLFTVDANGVAFAGSLGTTHLAPGRLHHDNGTHRLYADDGENVDEQGLDPRRFPLPAQAGCASAIDGPGQKAFFACAERRPDTSTDWMIRSFDLATQTPLGHVFAGTQPPNGGSTNVSGPLRLLRFGKDGLAVTGLGGTELFYNGAFVH